jgi:Cu(I)/Ag(I) efflux system membrane fusion protein
MNSINLIGRRAIVALLIAAIAIAVGVSWLTFRNTQATRSAAAESRKILYYQSPMHPWVKSDKPGKCTVCGMELVPVFEGGGQSSGPASDIVMLPEGAPNVASIKTAEVRRR